MKNVNLPILTMGSEPTILRVYNLYRLMLSGGLAILSFIPAGAILLNVTPAWALGALSLTYLAFNIVTLLVPYKGGRLHSFTITWADIIFLTTLLYLSENPNIALGNLVIVAIAAGNILLPIRLGLLLAALASIAVLAISIASSLSLTGQHDFGRHINVSVLGVLYFAVALVVQSLSSRVRKTEAIARQSRNENIYLQRLNTRIVQRMKTGIVVLRNDKSIVMMNKAAAEMLSAPATYTTLSELSPELMTQYLRWQQNPTLATTPFQAKSNTPKIKPSFSYLNQPGGKHTLIFLDDISVMSEHAQQLKLASLGRLTAGIAHEIRNPLGAISHAAQLLDESTELQTGDQRLAGIIINHCQRMNNIIETVLHLSRRNISQLEPIAIITWLQDFINAGHFEHLPSHKIHLQYPHLDITAYFDPIQLQQVLINLITNALQHSATPDKFSEIYIKVGYLIATQQSYLDIMDTGPGVAPETIDKLFEPFFTTESHGTGLGLFICKELCEANQANIEYIPADKGACFRITFATQANS